MAEKPKPFRTPEELRAWLEANHETATELWVKLARKGSGKPSITWPELVDEVLCFGWIDGHAKGIDDIWRMQRITPRKSPRWSARNVGRAEALIAEGRMRPAGLAAFEARTDAEYSYERPAVELAPEFAERLSAKAAAFLERQIPSYRRTVFAWVMNAKQEATRERRLAQLNECSERGEAPPPYRWAKLKP